MKPNSFLSPPDGKRVSTFTKNTNTKYFGTSSNDQSDMKKSSILLNYQPKQDSNKLLGTKPVQTKLLSANERPLGTENYPQKKQKVGGMYSSMIVGKSDEYKNSSLLASSDKAKQLNDWADQLKKKLTPFLDQQNKKKEDLVNKYAPTYESKQQNYTQNNGVSAFSKTKVPYDQELYSKDFTDYSKFSTFLKTQKKANILSNNNTQLVSSNYQPSTSFSLTDNSFKKYSQPSYTNFSTTNNSYSLSQNNSKSSQDDKKVMSKSDFQIGKKLGNGMFGQVFLVRHKTLKFVCAMKILKKQVVRQQKVEDQLVRQIKIQFFLKHQNVINLYGFFFDSQCVYLLQQLCMDGHLFSMLKIKNRFEETQAADIIKQVCIGLDYIHRQRIIHRDIKPENIIMHQGVAKICDFGWGVYRGDGLRSTFCGTPLYTPPELLRGQMYDQKFDIWAIGILAYQLIVGRFPFKIFCEDDLNRILTDQITFPFSVDVTPDAKNFILSIIRKDPRDRIQIDEILMHPFLRKNCKAPLEIDFKI